MVDPAWFFSTLPQATAAIVGFLISLRAIQYQLEKQRRETRTRDARQDLLDFKEKYMDILHPIAGQFYHQPDSHVVGMAMNLSQPNDRNHLVIAFGTERPTQALYYHHLVRVSEIIRTEIEPSPDPESHYLLSDTAFRRLEESVTWLKDNFTQQSEFMEYLQADLEIDGSSPYVKDVFNPDPPGESVRDWLLRYFSYAEEQQGIYSGKSLQSFQRIVEELYNDYQRIDATRANTIADFDPKINEFLVRSVVVILIGVVLPAASLLSNVPAFLSVLAIDSTSLYIYELSLLIVTFALILSLVAELQSDFGDNDGNFLDTGREWTRTQYQEIWGNLAKKIGDGFARLRQIIQ